MANPAFRIISIVIPANGMTPFHCPYNNLAILSIAGGTVKMKWGDSSGEVEQEIYAGLGFELQEGETMGRMEFYNQSGASVTVLVAAGLGRVFDRRLVLAGGAVPVSPAAASSSFNMGLQLDVRSAPTIAANTSRKSIDIRNTGPNALFLRSSTSSGAGGDDSHGLRINPGETYSAPTTAAISFRDNTSLAVGTQIYNYVEYV